MTDKMYLPSGHVLNMHTKELEVPSLIGKKSIPLSSLNRVAIEPGTKTVGGSTRTKVFKIFLQFRGGKNIEVCDTSDQRDAQRIGRRIARFVPTFLADDSGEKPRLYNPQSLSITFLSKARNQGHTGHPQELKTENMTLIQGGDDTFCEIKPAGANLGSVLSGIALSLVGAWTMMLVVRSILNNWDRLDGAEDWALSIGGWLIPVGVLYLMLMGYWHYYRERFEKTVLVISSGVTRTRKARGPMFRNEELALHEIEEIQVEQGRLKLLGDPIDISLGTGQLSDTEIKAIQQAFQFQACQ